MLFRRLIKSTNNNIKNFSLIKKQKVNSLGRWSTEDNPFLKVDFANNDSYGGPLYINPTQVESDLKVESTVNDDKNIDKKYCKYSEDELKYNIYFNNIYFYF